MTRKTPAAPNINEVLQQADNLLQAEEIFSSFSEWQEMMTKYNCAIREIRTKFEVLNDELSIRSNRNPIHGIYSRIKNPRSILDKLHRKGMDLTMDNVRTEINDIAGVRVICDFADDIYEIADMLLKQDDIKLISYKDYIRAPKPNGYRSYHMIVETPVFFSEGKEMMKVEVQLRTIAMDFWASLEHELRYKKDLDKKTLNQISEDLLNCANTIADVDNQMMNIKDQLYPKFPEQKE
jgi:putative GTP pyrophosphokinase